MKLALILYTRCDLGRGKYIELRKLLKSARKDISPPWYKVRELMGRITPEVKIEEDETAKMKTFSFPLLPAVNIMVAEIAPWPK